MGHNKVVDGFKFVVEGRARLTLAEVEDVVVGLYVDAHGSGDERLVRVCEKLMEVVRNKQLEIVDDVLAKEFRERQLGLEGLENG